MKSSKKTSTGKQMKILSLSFDIAFAPEINISLDNEQNEIKFYKISVSDEMINQQVEMAQSQLGSKCTRRRN
jgi:hypothetical protein